jgi:sigma-E factor negative regulatory protein RseC
VIESAARVVRTEAGQAWVISEAPQSCGACGGKGCGSSLYARLLHPRDPEFQVANPINAEAGEAVVIGVPDGALLQAVLASYLVPLLLILAGAALGQHFGGEPISALGALTGLAISALWLKAQRPSRHAPSILRRGTGGGCRSH